MTELIGKVGSEYMNILNQSDNIIKEFDASDIDIIDYSPKDKLDDDEWFRIINFSQSEFYIQQCNSDFSTVSLNQIQNSDYNRLSAICIVQNEQRYFQRITPSLFVNRKTILDYSGAPQIVEHRNQIEIRKGADAIYNANYDTLYFKTIGKLKHIFPGIEELYREATQEEVDTFIENNFMILSNLDSRSIGAINRKRIADIGVKFNNLPIEKKELLIAYAKENSNVEIENDAFKVESETDLKKILYALDQRYYYADVYEENRVASSVRVLIN